jgi:membrane-bound lytic murein transglycosylase D
MYREFVHRRPILQQRIEGFGLRFTAAKVRMHYKGLEFCELFKRLELTPRLKPDSVQMTSPIRRILLAALLPFVCVAFEARADEWFPRPPELEPDVNFWVSIFTEYDSDQGVLHDSRNLAVVYERIDIPVKTSGRERRRLIDQRRSHLGKLLRILASGKRKNLSSEEQRVLGLWPEGVPDRVLAEAIDNIRYQQGLSDRFREGLKRAGRYRAHVHREFARLGIPVELAALPHVESSYNPDARSHVGASGIWQFTRSTGRRFMQVDHVLDERNDPFAATVAAGRLLAYNYSITGNWPMAITAYNHGLAGVRRAMQAHGDTAYVEILRDYRGRAFGFASRNFYVAFLAALQVDRSAERYFPGLTTYPPVDYETIVLDAYVPADSLAAALGISQTELALHNPALQATVWQGSKHLPRNYQLRLPRDALQKPIGELMAALPGDAHYPEQLPDLFHTIAPGDTLSQIAREYDTSVSSLVALNNLGSRNRIRAGQQLRLPAAGPMPVMVASVEEATEIAPVPPEPPPVVVASIAAEPFAAPAAGALADDVSASVDGELQLSLLSDPSDYTVAGDRTIEVHPLETLGHFADWLGIKTQRLRDINGLAFRTQVEVGQRIKLDLSQVDVATFETLRAAWHREQQDAFFRNHRITGVREHVVENGESVWLLALQRYDVPVWLFRQYNPELDLHKVRKGARLNFPILASNTG